MLKKILCMCKHKIEISETSTYLLKVKARYNATLIKSIIHQ